MVSGNRSGIQADFSSHQLGNYRLIRSLGVGSFAFVYLGEHIYLKRLAAIKVLRTILTESEMNSFLEEAQLLASLSHPHIIRVLEFSMAQRSAMQNSNIKEHIPFLVMDYAPTGNLRRLFPAGSPVPLDIVIITISQVADALQYAHERNIIHRDIKPENLLMNERHEVMLSDFGLALFAASSPDLLNRQGMAGTLAYTAPEQLQGKPSFASDQYSLAIIAYEWLCGSRPFVGEDVEIILQHVSSSPPRLQSKNPLIPQAVENVILKALSKDPRQRYQSVLSFAQALERASHQVQVPPRLTMPMRAVGVSLSPTKMEAPAFHYFTQNVAKAAPVDEHHSYTIDLENKRAATMSPSTERNRLRMIQKVRAFWVYGVLKQSLRGTSFITLGLDEKQDAVANSWSSNHHQSEKKAQPLSPGTTITEIYDHSAGELLILGEAGSGKTTLLLELARNLLDRAERDETAPIPVILPLSSWTEKRLPLEEWFIEELNAKYQVPRLLGEQWVRNEMLLPLLDGLDEVAANVRSACVVAINTYKVAHGLSSLVVCSRLTEYLLFPPRVLLHNAIVVRPLVLQQIEDYLRKSAGQNFDVIYSMLRNDLVLQQLVTKPLTLNIIAVACQDQSAEEILQMGLSQGRYQYLFGLYVEQMLRRYQTATPFSPQQLTRPLAYLAMQMQRHNQTVFYLEQLQPDWIEDAKWLLFYREFAVMLPGALIGALTGILSNVLFFHAGSIGVIYIDAIYGTVMGYMLSGKRPDSSSTAEQPALPRHSKSLLLKGEYFNTVLFVGLITFLFIGLSKGWLAGLVNGVVLGLLSFPLSLFFQKSCETQPHTRGTYNKQTQPAAMLLPLEHLKKGTLAGLACGLTSVITILVNQNILHVNLAFLLTLGVRDSLRNALLGTLLSLLLVNNDGLIHRAEIVSWSWKIFFKSIKFSKNMVYDALLGIIIGAIFAGKQLFQGNMNNTVSAGLGTSLLVVISTRLIYALLRGVSNRRLDDHYRSKPNEGIRRSLYHGLAAGAIGIFVTTCFSVITSMIATLLSYGSSSLPRSSIWLASIGLGLSNALLLAPTGGLLAGLLLGGLAFLQYTALRFILWRTRNVPRDLFLLLEDATAHILLHKVGGGYLFAHRFLLEFFAALHDNPTLLRKPTPPASESFVKLLDKRQI